MNDFNSMAKKIEKDIIQWRRDLHSIPELGLELPKTSGYVLEKLEPMELEIRNGIAKSGISALLRGGTGDKTIAIRADMDALPIEEETGLPFSSKHPGKMHACGHDAHTAMALGAAHILHASRDILPGNVKFIFQPGEEGPGGAKPMIEEGVLDNPKVDAIIGQHIGGPHFYGDFKAGDIAYNPRMACLDRFSCEVRGSGGHGALPHKTVDPVTMSSSIIGEWQTLISRELSPVHPGVITVGKISGGTAFNIIPEKVELEGTARFIHQEERELISRRMGEMAEKIAEAKRGKVSFNYHYGYPPLVTEEKLTDFLVQVATSLFGETQVKKMEDPLMGGEDMAYFLNEVPGTFYFLVGAREKDGHVYPNHHPKFDVYEDILWKGSALLAATAFKWLKNA